MKETVNSFFAPQLYIPGGVHDIEFYTKALGAEELRRFTNNDGSIHVAELSINGTVFHLHEQTPGKGLVDPRKNNSTTVMIGLFVPDVDVILTKAKEAGATITSPAQDYDYGYRQGEFIDPFGHHWLIEKEI
jgi:PhnB protein